ncbi:MAG: hypothetical protein ACRECI_13020 [Methyloceanibacter sp.]
MIGRYIKPILLVSGVVTASMIVAFFAPGLVLHQLFAEPPADPVSLALMRHWALLVFCFGGLLIYAAYYPGLRKPVLIFTIVEKIALVLGILFLPLALRSGAYVAAASDATFSALYLLYLAGL